MAKKKAAKKAGKAATDKGLQVRMNNIISENLWAPRGDPYDPMLTAAADAYKVLKERGLTVNSEQEVVNTLRRDNIEEVDYLKDVPGALAATENPPEPGSETPEEHAARLARPPSPYGSNAVGELRKLLGGKKPVKFNTSRLQRIADTFYQNANQLQTVPFGEVQGILTDLFNEVHAVFEELISVLDDASEEDDAPVQPG